MAGQNHSRDFYLYCMVRKIKNQKSQNPEINEIFTSTVENLEKENLFLDIVSKHTKRGRHIRAAANAKASTFVPAWTNPKSGTKRKISSSSSTTTKTNVVWTMEFAEKLEEMTVNKKFPENIKTIPEKCIYLANKYKKNFDRNNDSTKNVTPSVLTITDDKIHNETIEKLVQLDKDSVIERKMKKAQIRKLAEQLLQDNVSSESSSCSSESSSSDSESSTINEVVSKQQKTISKGTMKNATSSESSSINEVSTSKQITISKGTMKNATSSESSSINEVSTSKQITNSKGNRKPVVIEKNNLITNDMPPVIFTPLPSLKTDIELGLDLFKSLNDYPELMKQNATKMNANEYICSTNLNATKQPSFILFISKRELNYSLGDQGYSELRNKEKAIEFLNRNQRISLLFKMPTNRYYNLKETNYNNFFAFLNHIINKDSVTFNYNAYNSFLQQQNNDEKLCAIVKDLVPKLATWCGNDIFKSKLQNIANHIQKTTESFEAYLPNEQVDYQFLNLIDFPEDTNPFSLFCDNENIPGYAQLGYSFVDKIKPCPNIKYVATSFDKLCRIVNGRFGLLRSNNYTEIILNTFNERCPDGTLLQNELRPLFNDLAEALSKYIRENPTQIMDLSGEHTDHFASFPHPDSDNSDEEDHTQKNLSSEITFPNNISFTHRKDLACLLPANRINDNVINTYLLHIQKQYEKDNPKSDVIICTNTLAYTAHTQKTSESWSSLIHWTKVYKDEQLRKANYIIYPIFHDAHWVWYGVNVKTIKDVKLVCFDSLCSAKKITGWKRTCSEWIIDNINKIYESLKSKTWIDRNNVDFIQFQKYPQQPDIINCGLYTLLGIEEFLNDKEKGFIFTIDEPIKDYNERQKSEPLVDMGLFDDLSEFS